MGMFDTVYFSNIEFPDGKTYNEEFQSKSLRCMLHQYRVTSDGRLTKFNGMFYEPVDLTATVYLNGPPDVVAEFSRGRLESLRPVER
jgi:hypothetical protein